MDIVVTLCRTLARMLYRVKELVEEEEDQNKCIVLAAEKEINMSMLAILIQVKVKINNLIAQAIVDSRALENFILLAEARRLEIGITRKAKKDQYTL